MKILPESLFARTAVLIAALILASQVGWMAITYALVNLYSHGEHQHPIADLAVVVDRELVRLAPGTRRAQATKLVAGTGVRLAWRPPRGRVIRFPPSNPFLRILQRRLGPRTRLVEERHRHLFWIALPVPGSPRTYWLVVPQSPFWRALPYTTLLGLVFGLLVALLGAVLVSNRLSRRLGLVTEAAEAIGRGDPPSPLPERGARELRRLSAGVNRMAEDIRTRAEDHREILAGLSHDLRTPLTRMRLALELSEAHLEPELAAGMDKDLDDMDRIVADFLDYARHGREESPTEVDLARIVRDVVNRYRLAEARIDLSLPAACPLHGRPLALARLVTNLVDNAVRHGRGEEDVEVRLERTAEACLLSVDDGGPGLDPETARVFLNPRVKARTGAPSAAGGTGLLVVGRIARLHNATVTFLKRPGGGTSVRVRFPASPTESEAAISARKGRRAAGKA
jgi:two-component system osmolarity sensor histidine kinase EnvZ